MVKNLSNVDRAIRVLLALAMASLYFFGVISGTTAIILLVIAAVFVATSIIGFCPIYAALGIRTLVRH
jgi:K+-transporting ATPase A subunit